MNGSNYTSTWPVGSFFRSKMEKESKKKEIFIFYYFLCLIRNRRSSKISSFFGSGLVREYSKTSKSVLFKPLYSKYTQTQTWRVISFFNTEFANRSFLDMAEHIWLTIIKPNLRQVIHETILETIFYFSQHLNYQYKL